MKALFGWLDQRTALGAALQAYVHRPLPGGARWSRVWPCTIAMALCIQAVTGFFLWMYYSPGVQTAWESVYFLQHEVIGGWLLRAMHHYCAQLLLVLVGIYLIQQLAAGVYRAPRELVFWTTVLLGLLTLALMLTGDLLAWDQNSYAATQVRTKFLMLLPGVGGSLYKIAIGGPAFGHLTLTRFLALHIGLFAGSFVALLILHGVALCRADSSEAEKAEKIVPYWPDQAARNAVACLLVVLLVLGLSLQHGVSAEHRGVALGSPADLDPANYYAAARPEWAFLGLYEFSHLFAGEWAILPIFCIPGLVVLVFLAMPFIGRYRPGHYFNLALTFVLLLGVVRLSFHSLAKDRDDEDFQAAVSAERALAGRVVQLARSPQGIPVSGALWLLRNDPLIQGPKLFKQHCASCHDSAASDGKGIRAEESSAPNLSKFAGRGWLAGFLDPGQINGPNYFGDTKFKSGTMADFVEDSLGDLDDEDRKDLEKLVAALSAEAQLKSQRRQDADDAKIIAEGRELLADYFGCADCHKFHDEGKLGAAPDLTGYGSREWLVGIISNPAHKRFYGKKNDRMPAYAEFPDDPANNTLSARDIGLLADWLRGDWYQP